jgi:RNA polymerase sigma-70 factor (ECF subfamily)
MIAFACPSCGKKLGVKEELAGKRARCPQCGHAVRIPAAAPQAGPAGNGAGAAPTENPRPPGRAPEVRDDTLSGLVRAAQEGVATSEAAAPPARQGGRRGPESTPASLLEQVRQPGHQEAWARFVSLYTPLIYSWGRQVGLQDQDAADLVQDVFTLLVQKLPEFTYDRHKSFRAWLRTVTLNKWRNNRKRRGGPAALGDAALAEQPGPDRVDAFWETEYHRHLVARALEVMRAEFQPSTWQACWEFVVCGKSAAEVAAQLGLSENAVYIAKCRVLRRLRQELAGLLE